MCALLSSRSEDEPNGAATALMSKIPVASHSAFQILVSWRTKVSDRVSPTPGWIAEQYCG
jgi:hypothetical protein